MHIKWILIVLCIYEPKLEWGFVCEIPSLDQLSFGLLYRTRTGQDALNWTDFGDSQSKWDQSIFKSSIYYTYIFYITNYR